MRPLLVLKYCSSQMAWVLSCGRAVLGIYQDRQAGKDAMKEAGGRF